MHRPVLITAPETPPVSVEEARRQCRIDADSLDGVALAEVDALLEGYIAAAVGHLEGWTGILGGVIAEQTWSQDFDCFSQCLRLPLGPVMDIVSVTVRNSAGQISTISDVEYALKTDAAGRSVCRFRNSFSFPSDLYETGAVTVTYVAGYPEEDIPKPIKQAILLMVGAWYENREETVIGVSVASLPNAVAVDRLVFPFRRNLI